MTLHDYIKSIKPYFLDNQPDIIAILFKESGAIISVDTDTAKSWLKSDDKKGHRNCRVKDYFPKEKLNEAGFIKAIESRVNTSWKQLQESFRLINDNGIIDIDTDNHEIFYWSLLNQFQKILRLPLSDQKLPDSKPAVDNNAISENSEKKGMPHNEALPESMLSVFYQNSIGFAIDDFINSPAKSITPDRIRDMITFIGCIMTKHENEDNPDKGEETYKKIIEFTDTLYKYIVLLKMNSVNPVFPECFELANDNDDKFKDKAIDYIEHLIRLYSEIVTEYENEEDEKMDKKRAAHKKIFENIEPGALDELSDSIFS